jgi:diguanylate cyclase (GGDEF)-like protein/PAS domain S-box-containing protein
MAGDGTAERNSQPSRRHAGSLPLLAGGLAAAAVVLFLLRAVWDLGTAGAVLAIVLTPSTFMIAGGAAWWAAETAHPDRVLRRFWRLVGTSHLAVALSGLGIALDLTRGEVVAPVTLALVVVATALLLAALVSVPLPVRVLGGRITIGLDLAIVFGSGALMALFLAGELDEAWRGGVNAGWMRTCMAAAVVGGMLMVAKVTLHGTRPIDPRAMRHLTGATVFAGVVSGALELMSTATGLSTAYVAVPLVGVGFVLAAERQREAIDRPSPPPGKVRPYSLMPYVALGMFNVMTVYAVLHGSGHLGALTLGSVVLTALVVGRQIAAFHDNARLLIRLDASLRDVQRQEHRFRALVRNSSDIIAINDVEGRATYVSPGVEAVLQITPEELIGDTNGHLMHPDDHKLAADHVARVRAIPGGVHRTQARFRRADGSWRWLEMVTTNLYHDPDIRGLVSNLRDITETREYQEELAHQASHDELTNLINRSLFVRMTDAALGEDTDDRAPERTVVVLVDLDDFKSINDRLGHTVGDELLVAVGNRLRGGVRPEDVVARLGGDEFAVLLRGVEPTERMDIARRIIGELAMPLSAGGYELLVRASAGVAPGAPGADANELLRRADLAMYTAKSRGRGRCTEFDESMDEQASEHARLAADLSTAIERGELTLVYQPIVGLPDGELAGVEALLRWTHPVRGPVSPAEFVPVAERTGLIVPLGAWVLYEACQQGATWLGGLGAAAPARISVNVSARQLIEPDFPTVVEQALLASGLPADRLTVEITETAVFDGGPAMQAVATMRAMGVKIALDDFGTGHSSLGLLRTCPIDVLKVDKSFVDGVGQSVEQEAIVTSLSQIGTAMRLEVVAEGVETASQAERLHVLGYRYAQGFHFARPMPPADVEARVLSPTAVG